jgi:hypothetical protein
LDYGPLGSVAAEDPHHLERGGAFITVVCLDRFEPQPGDLGVEVGELDPAGLLSRLSRRRHVFLQPSS